MSEVSFLPRTCILFVADHCFYSSSSTARIDYANAYTDFYGSGTPCVFKWPTRKGPDAQGFVREARPIYGHAIAYTWLVIGHRMVKSLDSRSVLWTSINPLAYANAGETKPFCPFVISIGVKPYSILYSDAVTAAKVVHDILTGAGFPTIEVAIVESVVTRLVAVGPKLLSFNPLLDNIPELRKPFTNTLGLGLAPLNHPRYEGTGALYYRLSKDDKRVAILTCAHVARPRKNAGQAREEIVTLGHGGYIQTVGAIMKAIGNHVYSMQDYADALAKLGAPAEGEKAEVTEKRTEYEYLLKHESKKLEAANALHDDVTKHRTLPSQRVVGFVLHSEEIKLSVEPYSYTEDWALVELYDEKIDWSTFLGNKVFVGGNMSIADFRNTMFPHDWENYRYPENGLLQAQGIVQDAEFRNPQHLDVHNEKCLLVVKNGVSTGTTVGRANGLESFTRHYDNYNIHRTSIEFAVLGYGNKQPKFSDAGRSGSIVLARDGRIVGLLTGGSGPSHKTDITYITPYWWLEKRIKAKFPDCFLFEAVE
ncbi:hypothetical protein BC629DRAFT_1642855 [Irpex lacteus]|nr:hypothetical protein BC629DRAFT_1642855 [Irpex lacteus]